ncbi:MAG: squalene/phytoene synthase family protein, partial [Candidatus Kapaibacteriota bacterium]
FPTVFFEPVEEFLKLYSPFFKYTDLTSAYKFCEKIAKKHYENFPVASWLLPKQERRFLHSIYSFSRLADDIADSPHLSMSQTERLHALQIIESNLIHLKDTRNVNNPIFYALKDTIEKKELPLEPFLRLLTAFKMDVNFVQPLDWNDLEKYCSFSANPIGELVLRIFGESNERTIKFSDLICTGLQLVNFWQDLSIDLKAGRCYIPKKYFEDYKIETLNLLNYNIKEKINIFLMEILGKTTEYFLEGWKLIWHLENRRLRYEINAIIIGGIRMLRKEFKLKHNLLRKRPKLNLFDYIYIFLNALI